jgi:polyisoprenoid-binding protein YceI
MPWTRIGLIVAALVVLGALGSAAVYGIFFRGSSTAPLALTPAPSNPSASASARLDGEWKVGQGSAAGYRVREQIGPAAALTDAVGRTNVISGSASVARSGGRLTLQSASFTADLSQLRSDRPNRDSTIHRIGLESDKFPSAAFKLTAPATLPADLAAGGQVKLNVHGELTLHGVTKTVDIPVTAQRTGDEVQVAGSLTFAWADFAMQPPNVGPISIQSDPTMEFSLNLVR